MSSPFATGKGRKEDRRPPDVAPFGPRLDLLAQPMQLALRDAETEGGTVQENPKKTEDDKEGQETGMSVPRDQEMTEGDWREALVGVCAESLGKKVEELRQEFEEGRGRDSGILSVVGEEQAPRDLADYAIMSMLKVKDGFSMQNARSWLFNLMDRNGSGFVFKDEFIRYVPFMTPIADAAVAGVLFDALLSAQLRVKEEAQAGGAEGDVRQNDGGSTEGEREEDSSVQRTMQMIRKRKFTGKRLKKMMRNLVETEQPVSQTQPFEMVRESSDSELPPVSSGLIFETWNTYVKAVREKYDKEDADWERAKEYLGIDMSESLIKAQRAVDHSDLWPTLGKLFLSERYLIFFAAVGRNHYVARLGTVSKVYPRSLPMLMRDCIGVRLENETAAALYGLSAVPGESSTALEGEEQRGKGADERVTQGGKTDSQRQGDNYLFDELTIPQQVGKLMKKYTSGSKDLCFSLLEFNDTRRRDHWITLIKEVAAAHRLHFKLGFGSFGRCRRSGDIPNEKEHPSNARDVYRTSPFSNEPPPPLLVFAAHVNIVRYRALIRVTHLCDPSSLLIFSHAEKHEKAVNWYIESVRSFDNWESRSWVTRAVSAIKENVEINKRMYSVTDDEPFDVARLGEGVGRFAELVAPLAVVLQGIAHITQWKNPPATILAFLGCCYLIYNDWVKYLPGMIVLAQCFLMLAIRQNLFGLGDGFWGGTSEEDARKRQAGVLRLVSKVHGALQAAQNLFIRMNEQLGKVQTLYLWATEEWKSWALVGGLAFLSLVLLFVSGRILFSVLVILLFTKHFTPPSNPVKVFWEGIPSKTTGNSKRTIRRKVSGREVTNRMKDRVRRKTD